MSGWVYKIAFQFTTRCPACCKVLHAFPHLLPFAGPARAPVRGPWNANTRILRQSARTARNSLSACSRKRWRKAAADVQACEFRSTVRKLVGVREVRAIIILTLHGWDMANLDSQDPVLVSGRPLAERASEDLGQALYVLRIGQDGRPSRINIGLAVLYHQRNTSRLH